MSIGVGIHRGVSPERYHRDECERPALSSSIACELVSRSPRHAWLRHPRLGGVQSESTGTMDMGTLLHSLVLGIGKPVVIVEADDWRTKAAKEAREHARENGAVAILKPHLLAAEARAKAVRFELARRGIRLDGDKEAVLVWEETASNGAKVLCRAQLDHVNVATGQIDDLKFSADASPAACQRRMVDMGYDIQDAAYRSALAHLCPELAGRVRFRFLVCEEDTDLLAIIQCGAALREVGERRWRRAVNRWAHCLATNCWPGYGDEPFVLDARPFEIARELEAAEEDDSEPPSSAPTPPSTAIDHQDYSNDQLF